MVLLVWLKGTFIYTSNVFFLSHKCYLNFVAVLCRMSSWAWFRSLYELVTLMWPLFLLNKEKLQGSYAKHLIIRTYNSSALHFVCACVCRTPDVELILSDNAFDEDKMIQKRHLMCPGWLVSNAWANSFLYQIVVDTLSSAKHGVNG